MSVSEVEVARPTPRCEGCSDRPSLSSLEDKPSGEREAFVGIDAAKLRNAIAIAEGGRSGEIRYLGEVDASETNMARVIRQIAAKYDAVHFCYEAGPTGYGLHRLITALGQSCTVVAPSLIPRKPGDRIKTNRRDATSLARLLRAGERTPVWVPDAGHEAMRDLVRARAAAIETLRAHRQQVSAFMLKHGRHYPGKKPGRAVSEVVARAIVRASGASDRAAGDDRGGAVIARTGRSIGADDCGVCRQLDVGTGRGSAASAARRRSDRRRDLRRGDRRPAPVRQPASADGLSGAGAWRTLDRRHGAARRDHQSRQWSGPLPAGGERLGPIGIRHASGRGSSCCSSAYHQRCGRLAGRPRAV